jgi:carboxypeptidase C (cathepsin A)
MIFLEQPVGVGFSYADHGEVIVSGIFLRCLLSDLLKQTQSTTEEAAQNVAAFFAILSANFPQFQGRKLHLASESYGVSTLCFSVVHNY